MYDAPSLSSDGAFFMTLFQKIELTGASDSRVAYKGKCARCGVVHGMIIGQAKDQAVALLKKMDECKRIDFDVPDDEADPQFSTDYLYGNARGQMFGVLICRDRLGATGVLKAFSGQYNSQWSVPGWVPPLVDEQRLDKASRGVERIIKRLGRDINALDAGSPRRKELIQRRANLSKALMKDIHEMYRVPNFHRELKPLPEVVYGKGGIPTGTGDCCAPKLLGYAARYGLTPLGLAEFYYGKKNKSGSRQHGRVYTSCKDKCGRILGYMLCGLDES